MLPAGLAVVVVAPPGGVLVLLVSVALGFFTLTDVLKWIYQFLAWMAGQVLAPIVTLAVWIEYLGGYAWAWIRAAGLYAFNFTGWVVQRTKELWFLHVLPPLSTLVFAGQLAESYFLRVADRTFVALRDTVTGSVLGIVATMRYAATTAELLGRQLVDLRAAQLKIAGLLDAQLLAVLQGAHNRYTVLRKTVNLSAAWVNHALDSGGTLRGELLVWSIGVSLDKILAEGVRLVVRPNWRERTDELNRTYPPMDPATRLHALGDGALRADPHFVALLDQLAHGRIGTTTETAARG